MKKDRYIASRLLRWYLANARDLPWRRTSDPYAIWVSEIMLQQTQVTTVIPYWERWMKQLPDLGVLARAPEETVLKLWEGLGYYSRARNLQKAARLLVEQFESRFPRDPGILLSLPGIGRYTAGAICSIAFNQPEPLVDGNVIRVLTRLFGIGDDPKQSAIQSRLWELAHLLVKEANSHSTRQVPACSFFNQGLMELGARICTPQGPSCPICPLKRHCTAFLECRTEEWPAKSAIRKNVSVTNHAFMICRNNQWLIRQRGNEKVNRGLWEFPNVNSEKPPVNGALILNQLLPGSALEPEHSGQIRHQITHHKITVLVYRVKVGGEPVDLPDQCRWVSPAALEALPLTAAHRRIARRFLPRRRSE